MRSQRSCRIGGNHDCCKWVNERTWTLISTDLKVEVSFFDVEYSWTERCSATSARTLIVYVDGMQNRQLVVHEYDHWRIHRSSGHLYTTSGRVYVSRDPSTRNQTLQSGTRTPWVPVPRRVWSTLDGVLRSTQMCTFRVLARLCTVHPGTRKCAPWSLHTRKCRFRAFHACQRTPTISRNIAKSAHFAPS